MRLGKAGKRQLASTITLALVSAVYVGAATPVYADSGQIGSATTPVTLVYYNSDPANEITSN